MLHARLMLPAEQQRREVVQFDHPAESSDRKPKRTQLGDGKSNVVIKAKSIPVSPKTVASSKGAMREKWLQSIYKEIENFLQNMAIDDADPALSCCMEAEGEMAATVPNGVCPQALDTVTAGRERCP